MKIYFLSLGAAYRLLGRYDVAIESLKKAIDSGLIVAMTSQCIFGRTDMNVYRSGVELLDLGVISCEDMLPETALVKLMWAIANSNDTETTKELLLTPIAGEIDMRSEENDYIKNLGEP